MTRDAALFSHRLGGGHTLVAAGDRTVGGDLDEPGALASRRSGPLRRRPAARAARALLRRALNTRSRATSEVAAG